MLCANVFRCNNLSYYCVCCSFVSTSDDVLMLDLDVKWTSDSQLNLEVRGSIQYRM